MLRSSLSLLAIIAISLSGCGNPPPENHSANTGESGSLLIFAAGSLSLPLTDLARAYETENPGVRIAIESSGSRIAARKIMELGRPCDLFFSADLAIIDTMLIPGHATWSIPFTSNEMCIVFHDGSRGAGEIDSENWVDILSRADLSFARCDPNSAPAGYRTVQLLQLAERHYDRPGLTEALLPRHTPFIRSQEPELFALLETRAVDYAFAYRTTAEQRGYRYVALPDEINLSNAAFAAQYAEASVEVSGAEPGETVTETGKAMVYGVTIPAAAKRADLAAAFLQFAFASERGKAIWDEHHQPLNETLFDPSNGGLASNVAELIQNPATP